MITFCWCVWALSCTASAGASDVENIGCIELEVQYFTAQYGQTGRLSLLVWTLLFQIWPKVYAMNYL